MKVLIADDSALILDRLTAMLEAFGQAKLVGQATNGIDALNSMRTLRPDLAILDLRMPGLTGLEVLAEIRKVDQAMKIIILTFYTSIYFREMAIQGGADYFFSKADDFDKVAGVVEEMLMEENRRSFTGAATA